MITKQELFKLIENSIIETVDIENIKFDKKLYSRTKGIDQVAVIDYSQNVKSIPAIITNQDNIIINGAHRYKALLKAEQKHIDVIKIEMLVEDITLAGLLIDLKSGVRHPETDLKKICVDLFSADPALMKQLREELDIPESTFNAWTADIRKEKQAEIEKQIIYTALDPFKKQKEIAEIFGKSPAYITQLLTKYSRILNDGKCKETDENGVIVDENLNDFYDIIENDIYLYNIWTKLKGDDENNYYGHFPIKYLNNLLYYHTKPFDFIYDPFAGGGTTIDACRIMIRKYYTTDIKPIGDRSDEIDKWDIKDGLPEMSRPDLAFLDPPYWKQAQGKYSDDPNDLSNMDLDNFNNTIRILLDGLSKKKVNKIAIVIQPTQYRNDFNWTDHIFDFDKMLPKYKIEMRYILPYSTQQYNAQMVDKAKEIKKCLGLNRDLVVWSRK